MTQQDRFDKFTERAKRVLSYAQEEAQRFLHNYIGTEHLLLTLLQENKGVVAQVLENLEIDTIEVGETIEGIIDSGDLKLVDEIDFTPRSKRVIELAKTAAQSMKHHYVGVEHLVLGIVLEGEGIAAGVLGRRGATVEKVRAEITKALGS